MTSTVSSRRVGWVAVLPHNYSDRPAPYPTLPTPWCCQGDRCPCHTATVTGQRLFQHYPLRGVVRGIAVLPDSYSDRPAPVPTLPTPLCCQGDRCPCHTATVTGQRLFQHCPLHGVVRVSLSCPHSYSDRPAPAQHCPLHGAIKQETWPKDTSVRDTLCADLTALRRTEDFLQMTGASI